MEMREFGGTGMRASVIGLGCNNFGIYQDAGQAIAVVRKALDVGINFLDMAGEHGSGLEESLVAEALGPRRKEAIIATKFGQAEMLGLKDGDLVFSEDKTRQGASRRWIMQAVEESLTRLKTDYIDLYQLHVADLETRREETLRALDDLVRQGKVRAIGEAATFATADDLNASQAIAANGLTPFATMEANYSILVRDAEKTIIPALRDHKMRLLPYFPLASGLLSGKYRGGAIPTGSRLDRMPFFKGSLPQNLGAIDRLQAFAEARGIKLAQLALAWLAGNPIVGSVIAGATSAEQVAQNAVAGDIKLSAADRAEIEAIAPGPVQG
ncbi:MAG TPA: aldo/keto reductase [Caulobacteraceae bacterium]|nr:aldo/keto reductase [Caulobacteraceae bacterium]